jgi:hypothetical protein
MVKVFLFDLQKLVKILIGLKISFLYYKKIFWIKKRIFGSKNLYFGLNPKGKLTITKFSLVKIYVNVYKDKI